MIRSIRLAVFALFALSLAAASLKKEKDRKRAPDFELKDPAGNIIRLSDYKGKVLLLNFWATWCVPCKTEIPWFIELASKYESEGLGVVGISMDEEGWAVVKPFVEKTGINYPVVLGSQRTAYLYGDIEALPVTFLVDRRQRVAAIHAGLARKQDLDNQIQKLLPEPAE